MLIKSLELIVNLCFPMASINWLNKITGKILILHSIVHNGLVETNIHQTIVCNSITQFLEFPLEFS